jgi:hypothetical protein
MSLLELRKIFLAVLLASFMALGMAACSSSGDSDDAAADESSSSDDFSREDCSTYPTEDMQAECELLQDNTGG